jgi:CheY-like chemotaxis protein
MKILIVDDDPGNRVIARRMLERHGGVEAMHIVDSGAACLDTAAKVRFDTILLDISMPDMDGVTVCQKLRTFPGYDTCRIVACTAHAGRVELAKFHADGFSATLTKPFLLEDLYSAVGLPPAAKR